VSTNHAVVLVEGEKLVLKDTSSNGVYINGVTEPIGRNRTIALTNNDTLAIGDYKLIAAIAYSRVDNANSQSSNQNESDILQHDAFNVDEPTSVSQATEERIPDIDVGQQSNELIQTTTEDLKLHQLKTLEAMKLTVDSLLMKFNPNELSKKLEKIDGVAVSIPATRKAKLWELFCEQYDEIREEATNDVEELLSAKFGKIDKQKNKR